MATTLPEFRSKYPEYNDLSDEELTKNLHQKFYSDLEYSEFSGKFNPKKTKGPLISGEFPGASGLGAIEGLARGFGSFVGTVGGGLAGAISNPTAPFEGGARLAREAQEGVENIPRIFSTTEPIEKEILGPAFEKLKEYAGIGLEAATKGNLNTPVGAMAALVNQALPEDVREKRLAAARTIGEVLPDVYFAKVLGKQVGSGLQAIPKTLKERRAARDVEEAAAKEAEIAKQEATAQARRQPEQLEFEFPQEVPYAGTNRGGKLRPEDMVEGPDGISYNLKLSEEIARNTREPDLFGKPDVPQIPLREEVASRPVEPKLEQTRIEETRQELLKEEPQQLPQESSPMSVPRGQRGQFNPSVFAEGFQKAKEVADKGFRLVARAVPGVKDTMLEITAFNKQGDNMGFAYFKPEGGDIYSASTHTRSEFQRRGVATEIYKFAEELGNDVRPSKEQTAEGRAFSLSRKQRGATTPEFLTAGLAGLINKAVERGRNRHEQKTLSKLKEIGTRSEKDIINSVVGEVQPLEKIRPNTVDLPDRGIGGFVTDTIAKYSDVNALARKTNNPMVRAIHERVASTDHKYNVWSDMIKEEYRIEVLPGARQHKIVSPDSVKYRVEKATAKQRDEAANIATRLTKEELAPDKNALLQQGHSQQAVDLAIKMYDKYKEMRNRLNETLITHGKKPINNLEGYFSLWYGEGRHIVRIRPKGDPAADSLFFHRAKTQGEIKQVADEILSNLKEKGITDVEAVFERAFDVGTGRDFNLSPGVMNDFIAALERSDPRRQVIRKAWEEVQGKYRAGGHAGRRRGVMGGELTGKDLYKAFERYTDQMAAYMKNVEIEGLWKELNNPKLEMEKLPNLKTWAGNYIDTMRGIRPDGAFLHKLENTLDRMVSLNGALPYEARKSVRFWNKAFLTFKLLALNIPFGNASLFQSSTFGHSQMLQYKAMNPGVKSSPAKAMGEAYYNMFDMSKDQKNFLEFASHRGQTDPSFISHMGEFQSKLARNVVDWGLLAKYPKFGERVSRVHAGLSAYNFFYDAGFRGKDLWTKSANMSNEIMVDYSRPGRAAAITDTGIVGQGASALTSFYNWYTTNLFKHVELAFKGKPASLLSFMSGTAFFTGVIGMPLFMEIDAAWKFLKNLNVIPGFNEKTPSLSEMLIENVPDGAVFGPLDTATKTFVPNGIRFGGSMAAPQLHLPGQSEFSGPVAAMFPGPVFGFETVKALSEIVAGITGGKKMTVQEFRLALKKASAGKALNSMWDNVDLLLKDTSWGGTYPEAVNFGPGITQQGVRGAGGYRREGWGDVAASMVGGGSLKEARAKVAREERFDREPGIKAAKSRVIDLIVDRMESGGDMESLVPLYKRATDLGMDPKDIMSRIMEARKARLQTEEERRVGRGRTRQQQELLEEILRREEVRN